MLRLWVTLLVFLIVYQNLAEAKFRQKRCIVIQKQSGTHGDSTEEDGGDEEYRKPQPKEPKPDRLRNYYNNKKIHDVENVSPELLKYQLMPRPMRNSESRLRNRLYRKYL